MRSAIQDELFGVEQYTRLCSICRGEFPRSVEFFPEGRCLDMMTSYCRKCANVRAQRQTTSKESEISNLYSLHKSCKECGEVKQLRQFYMSSQSNDGKTSACKNCTDEKNKACVLHQQRLVEFEWAVYFIQDKRNNRVKIGSSDNLEKVFSILQEGSSETLHMLANHESGDRDTAEMIVYALNSLLKNHHTGNGWFEMVPSLEYHISLIQHGDLKNSEFLLYLIENNETQTSVKLTQNENIEGVLVVDGQSFPSILSASDATGYTKEQLKKYLQKSTYSNSPVNPKIQKAG